MNDPELGCSKGKNGLRPRSASPSIRAPSPLTTDTPDSSSLEAEEPELLFDDDVSPDHEHLHWRRPAFVDRWVRSVTSMPGYERSSVVVNKVLGPSERKAPPPPSSHWQALWRKGLQRAGVAWHRSMEHPLDHIIYRFSRRRHLHWFWLPFLLVWITGNILLLRAQYYQPGPKIIGCTASPFSSWPPDACDLNGIACARYLHEATFRCPGGCHETPLGNPRWIGNTSVNGVPLIVGGNDGVYRADSWICPAAIHSGIISPRYGGCVRVTPLPYPEGASDFAGFTSSGLTSTAFGPKFPGAFRVSRAGSGAACMDYHWPITAFNATMLFLLTILFTPPRVVLFSTLLMLGFFHITLISDPPTRPPEWDIVLGRLLPVLVAGYWIWRVSFARSLRGFYASRLFLEMAVWQGFGFWVGVESSTLFARIPISRLGYGALSADALIALIIIIVLVIIVVGIQVLQYRRLGHVRYYLAWYLPIVPVLIVLANIGNGYYLRIHHYMLSLLGMPVLSLPNRISLFGQAFLLGFFLDGVGRWGWASILEHETNLRGDSASGSGTPVFTNQTQVSPSQYEFINWQAPNRTLLGNGTVSFSVVFDDVLVAENYTANNFSIKQVTDDLEGEHYLRVAYVLNETTLDYTDPSVWSGKNKMWTPSPTDLEDGDAQLVFSDTLGETDLEQTD